MGKIFMVIAILGFSFNLSAMGESDTSEELINQEMCRQHNHHFDQDTKECVYCAKHLKYKKKTKTCEGELSPLGKCYGDDHFHAATLECMYCAKDHEFNKETRQCESKKLILAD